MDEGTLENIAEFICGDDTQNHPVYRSGYKITQFFERAGLPQFVHDGSTRNQWVLERLKECDTGQLELVLKRLASPVEYGGDEKEIETGLRQLNTILRAENMKIRIDGVEPKIEKITADFSGDGGGTKDSNLIPSPDFLSLGLKPELVESLENRWEEAQRCDKAGAHLAAIIMMGSILEGLLLGVFEQHPKTVNKGRRGPHKKFSDWKLAEMIDVAHRVGWFNLHVQSFSHALRDFRNLIHPSHQVQRGTYPDADTCSVSWGVVQAVVNALVSKNLQDAP